MKNEYVQSNDLDISCNVASDFGIWKTFKKISGIYDYFLYLLYYHCEPMAVDSITQLHVRRA